MGTCLCKPKHQHHQLKHHQHDHHHHQQQQQQQQQQSHLCQRRQRRIRTSTITTTTANNNNNNNGITDTHYVIINNNNNDIIDYGYYYYNNNDYFYNNGDYYYNYNEEEYYYGNNNKNNNIKKNNYNNKKNNNNNNDNNNEEEYQNYRIIDGRRFHNVVNSKYMMPCDEDEFERLHIQHYICRFIWQKNYSAPIKEKLESGGALVLDVGCGPGTWVIEMANEFPKSHYTGIDICPIYPRDQIPPNVNFLECNILDGLPYHDNTFDYIHVRYLITAFSELDWQIALKELVRVTKVGGIIEIVEDEIEPRNDGPISRLLFSAFFSDLRSRNIDFTVFNHMIDMLLATQQLEDLKLEEISAPFGKWAGRIGTLLSENTGQIFRTFRSKFSSYLGLEQEEYDKLVEAWYNELNEYQPFNFGYRFLAQKK
ncbi:hypothetical protein Glove_34g39 [Diversispora epigaea]|uniref:Methyltransferase domain-containing protein n=1 Tax=Diversispora epigaea TaxID=1348612 RepID=A0A397JGR7_9GLOM|nr:hypothetical protein Glove_34g39 [Diversispora epigaea]